MYCSVVGGRAETVVVIRVQPLCLYFDVVCCAFRVLSLAYLFISSDIHPIKHTSGNGARPSGQQYSLFSCCNTLSADSSTFRLTITRHKSRISCLCSCDNNFMLSKQINGKRKKWLTNSFFPRTSSFWLLQWATLPLTVTLLPNCVMMVMMVVGIIGGTVVTWWLMVADFASQQEIEKLFFFSRTSSSSSFPHQEECGQDY